MRKKRPSPALTQPFPLPSDCPPIPTSLPAASPLLTAFHLLPTTDVYTMAPKDYVLRGYDYYRHQRLQHYRWNEDRSVLTARVLGTRLYTVTFALLDDVLSAACDCPIWNPEGQCKHVLCACFTTKRILTPDVFPLPDWRQSRLAGLRAELIDGESRVAAPTPASAKPTSKRAKTAATQPRYDIVIDARSAYPAVVIHKNGTPMIERWDPTLPRELLALVNPAWHLVGTGDDPLLQYLRRHPKPCRILVDTGHTSLPLAWAPDVVCRSKTELHLAGGQIHIRAGCLADDQSLERFVHVRTFIVDLDGARLLLLDGERGWTSFHSLRLGFVHTDHIGPASVVLPQDSEDRRWYGPLYDRSFTITREQFQSAQVDIPVSRLAQTLDDLMVTVEGVTQPLPHEPVIDQPPEAALILRSAETTPHPMPPLWTLEGQCRVGEYTMAPSRSTFSGLHLLAQGRGMIAPLRAQKRKVVLYNTYFALLDRADAKDRARRIRAALMEQEWPRMVVGEASRWLTTHLALYARPDVRLRLLDGRWTLQALDKSREALLYRIPFEVFGMEAFRHLREGDGMALESELLFSRLPELIARLSAAGIAVYYDDKPLRSARWDCAVHIERGERATDGIDWFEIKPEIRCDGVTLTEAEWRDALRHGGLIDGEQGLRVLDAHTMDHLRAILELTGGAGAGSVAARKTPELVRIPRLQILDWLALREQGVTVSLPKEDDALLGRLLGFTTLAARRLPSGLRATLRPYQRDGYAWLAFLYEQRFGACLADDMGLGKTLQAICLLAAVQEGRLEGARDTPGPHLIVVPTSLFFNWEQELARFAPGLTVQVYRGGERSLTAKDGDVVLTTYGLIRRDIERMAKTPFHVIVFDEAQAVKNITAETTGAVRRLQARFKLALTGTPLENHLGEYFSLVDLCLPGLLGDYEPFKSSPSAQKDRQLERLLRRTKPFILRRTKAEILHDLPPKIESDVFLDLSDRQKALYQETVAQVRSTIDEAYRTKTSGQAQFIALTALLRLRQICLSPQLLTGRADEPSPKLTFLMERLRLLMEEGHSALVFSQFTSFLDLVQASCTEQTLPFHRLDGSTPALARKSRVAAFQQGEQPSVFLLSLKAGGQGLNLTKATYVFHLDPWWNPAVENQASDRAHRIGQQRTVSIVRLLMRHSIEEKMTALKERKLALYNAVMAGAVRGSSQNVLTKADFDFLLAPDGA